MSILTVIMPNQSLVNLNVDADTLVFNGSEFVEPAEAKVVALHTVPTTVVDGAVTLVTSGLILASVKNFDPTASSPTDPLLPAAVDPSGGICIVGITCKGTLISYVRVNLQ